MALRATWRQLEDSVHGHVRVQIPPPFKEGEDRSHSDRFQFLMPLPQPSALWFPLPMPGTILRSAGRKQEGGQFRGFYPVGSLLSLSICLSICISLSRSLAINVRRFHIPSRTSFVAETDLADSIEDSKERFVGSFMISWIPDGGRRGCAKLMRLKRGVYLK